MDLKSATLCPTVTKVKAVDVCHRNAEYSGDPFEEFRGDVFSTKCRLSIPLTDISIRAYHPEEGTIESDSRRFKSPCYVTLGKSVRFSQL